MCDETTEADNRTLTRRRFTQLAAGTAMASALPATARAATTERRVRIRTPDGEAQALFTFPKSGGPRPGVLIWPDILGLRPAFEDMARRLAGEGYAVLVIHPFYRSAPAPVVSPGETFADPEVRERVMPMARALSAETHRTDARAFIAWLDQQAEVDTAKGVGTQGYCMGGPMVFRTAATLPGRVKAAASFHGGGLVTEDPDSPHTGIARMQAELLVCVAQNDDAREPEVKDVLRQTAEAAGRPLELEVYPASHGWCPADSPVHDPAQAQRAWSRLLALYARALA